MTKKLYFISLLLIGSIAPLTALQLTLDLDQLDPIEPVVTHDWENLPIESHSSGKNEEPLYKSEQSSFEKYEYQTKAKVQSTSYQNNGTLIELENGMSFQIDLKKVDAVGYEAKIYREVHETTRVVTLNPTDISIDLNGQRETVYGSYILEINRHQYKATRLK